MATLDFTASRKRMTVIVEDEDGKYHLYCKGADAVIFRYCNSDDEQQNELIKETKKQVTNFARDGSRTLVMAWKPLTITEYKTFINEYRKAEVALNHRKKLIENAFAQLENNLFILGATAVEDQMQDGVPQTIKKLKEANIKIIMLTGDKQETAVSIGRQSGIINDCISDNELMFIQVIAPYISNSANPSEIQQYRNSAMEKQMRRVERKLDYYIKHYEKQFVHAQSSHLTVKTKHNKIPSFSNLNVSSSSNRIYTFFNKWNKSTHAPHSSYSSNRSSNYSNSGNRENNTDDEKYLTTDKKMETALILNGDALEIALHAQNVDKFIKLFNYSTTIVCNRANPTQKAMLVQMAKKRLSGIALAIGDGANDVSMIQVSNVGIGIMGKEGTQAALAADFIIHRFKHLIPLLFVHGRYSYLRTSSVTLLLLYKNMAFNLVLCYFAFYSLFTAQSCFNANLMSLYSVLFSGLMPLVVGAFEKDIQKSTAVNHPKAYFYFRSSADNTFSYWRFCEWQFTAVWQSLVFFFVPLVIYNETNGIWSADGKDNGLWTFGTVCMNATVIVICLKMMASTLYWIWMYYFFTISGIVMYFVCMAVFSSSFFVEYDPDFYFIMDRILFGIPVSWMIILLQIVICMVPGMLYNLYKRERNASLVHILHEAEKFGYLMFNGKHRETKDIVEDYLKK